MYFKKLEIAGFKSFCEKTVLHFEPGITAVVGPNGCGKSNIFDSIRWCLGEQSIKSLRGAKMEDVIFNGTEHIPPQSLSEVSLTLSNEAKILPIEYDEVTITRRLFRSGESEYLLNASPVRLKDINELLMGTGIGAESYSLVEQGKIDLVISSRPEDRRLVFDEATGVSKYKAKKREAMKKLEETDSNLLRVNDIITEVKRQIGSIERQASKARRYKEIFDQLKEREMRYSSRELAALKEHLLLLSEMAKKSAEEERGLNEQLQELDKKLLHQQQQLQELDARLAGVKDAIAALEASRERNHQHIRLNQDRIADLERHAAVLAQQKEQVASRIAGHEKSIAELTEQLLSLHETYAKKESDLRGKDQALAGLNEEMERAQEESKTLKASVFEWNIKEAQSANLLNEALSADHTLLARQKRLEIEKVKTDEESSQLERSLESLNAEIAGQKENVQRILNRLAGLKEERDRREATLKDQEERLRHLENEKLALRSQEEFLKELRMKYDSMPQAQDGVVEIVDLPAEKVSGIIAHAREVSFDEARRVHRIRCELKFISFDIESLERRIEEICGLIESSVRAMQDEEKALLTIVNEIGKVEEEAQAERFQLTNKEAVALNLSENARKIQEELELIRLESTEVGDELNTTKTREESLKREIEGIKAELAQAEARIAANAELVARDSAQREGVLVEIAQLKTELANQKAQEDGLTSNLNFFKETLDQDRLAQESHDRDIGESLAKAEVLKEECLALEARIEQAGTQIEEKNKEHSILSQARTEELNGVDFTRQQIIDIEERTDKVKEEIHRTQMQEQETHFKYASIKNRVLAAYSVDLDETPAPQQPETADMEALAREIAQLREKVESFGTVNLVAIEELEELKNRHDFLTQQHNDLVMAKDSLQAAITKINRTTRKMFLETFQTVVEEFKNYFKLLFGGGEAKLYLIDEEDVLESGIEIICRPPGKKLQNITLLSGGEKALSAIALIFAIFKTKPSPFCVLDEIDAALDESNIDRFSRMLSDFSKTSQFIVITHNKKTISRANVMYGITMEQSGVSKIVSVKLHEKSPAKEAPAKETPSSEPAAAN